MHQTGTIYKDNNKDKMKVIKNIIHENKDIDVGDKKIINEDNDKENNR